MIFARRLADRLRKNIIRRMSRKSVTLKRMLDICRAVPFEPAQGFEQAVQSIWMREDGCPSLRIR